MCVCVCVRAYVRTCVHACVCACACLTEYVCVVGYVSSRVSSLRVLVSLIYNATIYCSRANLQTSLNT